MVTQSELVAALRGLIPLAEMSGADNRDPVLREAKRVLAKATPRITLKDTDLLSRLPQGVWFAAGAYSVHPAKLARLERLGLVERRPANWREVSRTWDWRRRK